MKICLAYPPNRNIPSCPYGALPLLSGCLGAVGHQVEIVDGNLEVFDRLIEPERIERSIGQLEEIWRQIDAKTSLTAAELRFKQGLAKLSIVPNDRLRAAPRAGRILRDRELFREPSNVNWAYDTISCLLRFYYSTNPLYYLLKPGALDEFFDYLETDIQNPIQELIEAVVVPQILATNPDLVGICIPFNEQMVEAFALLKALRRARPGLRTVVGGAIVTSYAKKLCLDPRFYEYADFALPGEADTTFPQFATALEQGTDLDEIPNLYRREDGRIIEPKSRSLPDLNDIAAPDFGSVPVGRYYLPETIVNYQTSRGCYYGKCTFCSFDIKQNFRLRKPALVCDDIDKIYAQTGAKHFIFWDPLTPPKLMKGVSEWNRHRGEHKIYWGAETKFEKVFLDPKYTDLLYDGGARFLQFGFESGSQRVLDLMVKGNDLSRVDAMLDCLRDSKIAVSVQWFIGFPGETEEEARESFRYLDRRRDAVLLSSYMGTFMLSPDDDIFRSNGDIYDLEIFQRPDGQYDFRYKNPPGDHYDREELDAAFLARGDSESVTRMAFYVYLTDQPERAKEISNLFRVGMLPDSFAEIASAHPALPDYNLIRSFDFDIFTEPVEGAADVTSKTTTHALFNPLNQRILQLFDRDLALVRMADGTRTGDELATELAAEFGGDVRAVRARLLEFVRIGVLRVPLAEPVPALT